MEGARHTAVVAFMIALGQPVMAALVATFVIWCLRVLEARSDVAPKVQIVVEGLIGAGKSTLVKKLGGKTESIEAWAPFLDWEVTQNPGRLLCRQIRILADYVTGCTPCRVHERSWASGLMFTKLMLARHDKRFFASYMAVLKSAIRSNGITVPNVVVYLNDSPETCFDRIAGRESPGDAAVTLKYLKELEIAHATLMGFYEDLGVTILYTNGMTGAEIEASCRRHMDINAEDGYNPDEIIKAVDRWFGAE